MVMASDIGLVLRSEHRDLLILADRCGRMSRGFQDPVADLRRRLLAHLAAAQSAVLPVLASVSSPPAPELEHAIGLVGTVVSDEMVSREALEQTTRVLVDAERADMLPVLSGRVPVAERRRMGKVFRMRRDSVLRGTQARSYRQRSQTELYELARRAGVEHRSTMTQSQLQAAVVQWEERRVGHGDGATG